MALLEVSRLSISFGGIRALAGLDLQLEENEILTVIGPNGSGKTTFFNCISGVYRPDSGEILFQGGSLQGLSPDEVALQRHRPDLSESAALPAHDGARQSVAWAATSSSGRTSCRPVLRRGSEEIRHRRVVEEIIEFLDLQAFRQARVSDCPYGVQKRVEMGRALAMEPRLLLLDEPIAGLTAEEKEETAYRIIEIRGRYQDRHPAGGARPAHRLQTGRPHDRPGLRAEDRPRHAGGGPAHPGGDRGLSGGRKRVRVTRTGDEVPNSKFGMRNSKTNPVSGISHPRPGHRVTEDGGGWEANRRTPNVEH